MDRGNQFIQQRYMKTIKTRFFVIDLNIDHLFLYLDKVNIFVFCFDNKNKRKPRQAKSMVAGGDHGSGDYMQDDHDDDDYFCHDFLLRNAARVISHHSPHTFCVRK